MIKTRPLCFVCLFFLIIQGVCMIVTSGKSFRDIPASSIFYDQKEKSVSLHGQVYKKVNTSNFQILYLKHNSVNDSNIIVYDENFIEISIGERVLLQGTTSSFEEARNPGNFDQGVYYARHNIYGVVWCDKVIQISGEANWLMENLYQFKLRWKEKIYQVMGEKNGAILSAMLLGEKNDMDADIKELYQKNGISHILAISGLHISFIGLGIYKIIKKTGLGYVLSGLVSVVFLSLYVLMIGMSVSVIRAFIMLLFRIGADMSGRVYDMLTSLMAAAAITVGIQPLCMMDAGFLMSYGAILGILFVLPVLERLLTYRWKWLAGFYASLAINIMLFPIMLYFYFEISIYSILLNLLVIPLMSLVLGFGMIGSLVGFLFWPIAKVSLTLCNYILEFFEWLSSWASKMPMARSVLGKPDLWKLILYYVVLVVSLIVVLKCKETKGIWQKRIGFCGALCVIVLFMVYKPIGSLTITMLDVGQGDGVFLRGPKGNTYFIDGGSSDILQLGKYRIEPFLKSQGVGELDYVFVTHGDADHYSGIVEMIDRQDVGVKIKRLVLPVNWKWDESMVELAKKAKMQKIPVVVMEAGQRIEEGGMKIACIQPDLQEHALSGNAGSLVLEVRYDEFSMLFTGDVELEGETALIKKITGRQFDVLKVAHHGSKNSSSEEFLKAICAKVAMISAGEKNSYGHPHRETMDRLKKMGCKIYSTIKSGAITIQTDGNSLTFHCFIY